MILKYPYFLLLTALFYAQVSLADSCTINTKKIKDTLTCLNQRLNNLEGVVTDDEPVYQDNIIKINVKASRESTSNPLLYKADITLIIKNISGSNLLLAQNERGSYAVTVADNTGISCQTQIVEGMRSLYPEESNPALYMNLKSNKKAVLGLSDSPGCMERFKGSSFNISVNLIQYDYNSASGIPFTASMTGISAPLK